jgi:hypothetical protein
VWQQNHSIHWSILSTAEEVERRTNPQHRMEMGILINEIWPWDEDDEEDIIQPIEGGL